MQIKVKHFKASINRHCRTYIHTLNKHKVSMLHMKNKTQQSFVLFGRKQKIYRNSTFQVAIYWIFDGLEQSIVYAIIVFKWKRHFISFDLMVFLKQKKKNIYSNMPESCVYIYISWYYT